MTRYSESSAEKSLAFGLKITTRPGLPASTPLDGSLVGREGTRASHGLVSLLMNGQVHRRRPRTCGLIRTQGRVTMYSTPAFKSTISISTGMEMYKRMATLCPSNVSLFINSSSHRFSAIMLIYYIRISMLTSEHLQASQSRHLQHLT